MKKLCFIVLIAFTVAAFNQINAQCTHDTKSAKTEVSSEKVILCGHCGHIKGGKCCKADAEKCGKCEKCGLHKGSPGCCKMEAGKDAELCPKCGQIKGSKDCCAPNAEKCSKCGLHQGSPGCCKMKKT